VAVHAAGGGAGMRAALPACPNHHVSEHLPHTLQRPPPSADAPLLQRRLHRLTMPWPGLRAGHGVIAIQVDASMLPAPILIGLPAVLVAVAIGTTVPNAGLAT
jgi:hypothetical protein